MLNGIEIYDDYPHLAHIGNTLYFAGIKTSLTRSSSGDGEELFKSDGSVAGTLMVKDIYPGSNSSSPRGIYVLGNKILFFAKDDTTNNEWALFVSDGSAAGTTKVKDIHPYNNIVNYNTFRYANYATLNANMYFFANADDGEGIELYKSDGTPSGTLRVKDININGSSNDGNEGATLFTLGDAVYFIAEDALNGSALWKSDGTQEGTIMVKDIRPDSDESGIHPNQQYNQFTKVGDQLFFIANDGNNEHSQEIWKSDGTTEGTVMVADLNQSQYSSFVAVGDLLYFSADNEAGDPTSLWKTDGTSENTKIVAENNIYPDEKATGAICPSLFFHGNKYTKSGETWSYNDEEELWITKGDAQCEKKGIFPALFYLLF
jgi:ELWxxDGT repeat protein